VAGGGVWRWGGAGLSPVHPLYRAQAISGYAWLHGLKGGHLVHVGSVDAPVSTGDVRQIALEFKRAMGTGAQAPKTNRVDVLGWDFAS
jgi:hypothetical protein